MLEILMIVGLVLLFHLSIVLLRIERALWTLPKGLLWQLVEIQVVLRDIKSLLKPVEQKAVVLELYEVIDGELRRAKMVKQSIEEVKKYKVVARDKAGNEAALDGAAEISMTSDLADIIHNEDGSFDVAPKGPIGAAKLQLKADALIGEGVEEIFGEEDFEFVAGKAVSISVVPV